MRDSSSLCRSHSAVEGEEGAAPAAEPADGDQPLIRRYLRPSQDAQQGPQQRAPSFPFLFFKNIIYFVI
jgi:hypothetical protein